MTKPSKNAVMDAVEERLDYAMFCLRAFLPLFLGALGYTVSPSGKIEKNSRRKSVDLDITKANDLAKLMEQVFSGLMEFWRNA